jgi:iron complex outermembrane receptor protein
MSDAGTQPADSPAAVDLDIAKRIAHAFFGQVNIPVLGGEWSIPGFIEGLDVELGYRVDKYDFQDAYIKTPKVAATLTLGQGISLRGAWGKSFRAPGFSQASAAAGSRAIGTNFLGGGGSDSYIFKCNNTGTNVSSGTAIAGSVTALINPACNTTNSAIYAPAGIQLQGGSGLGDYMRGLSQSLRPGGPPKGLGPETAKQYVFGVNMAPTEGIFAGLNLDVSYFNIKISDTIRSDGSGSESGVDIGDNPLARHLFAVRPSFVTPGADDSEFNAIIDGLAKLPGSTSTFERERTYNFVFDGNNANVGFIHLKGIDFSFRYDWDMGNLGSFHIGTAGYYELDQLEQANDDSPVSSIYEGKNSGAQLKRLRSRAGWTNGTWSTTLFNTALFHQGPTNNIVLPDCYWREGFSAGSCYTGSPFFPQQYDQFYNTSPGWMQWDVNVTYNTGVMPTNEYLQNINISLTVNNFLDADPPQVFNSRSSAREIFAYDARFSELGRFASVTITKTW